MSSTKKVVSNSILTGAGNGIGFATAVALLKASAFLIAVDLRTDKLQGLQADYASSLVVISGDISKREVSEEAVNVAMSNFNQLDSIILNAGILSPIGPVSETKIEDWKRLYDVNFFALLHTIQLSLPYLRSSNGSIIMTSSGVSLRPAHAWIAYASAKRAMNCLCAGLKLEEPEVSTVCVTPGIVNTNMQKEVRDEHENRMPTEQYNWLKQLHDSGGLVQPEQSASTFARLVLYGIPEECKGEVVPWNDLRVRPVP
ncbi:NAD(P)-binding protein [Hyaloscypha variabilis]